MTSTTVSPRDAAELRDLDEDLTILARAEIDRPRIARYFFTTSLLLQGLLALCSLGASLLFTLVYVGGLGRWYTRRRADELDVILRPGRLLVLQGVFNRERKTIPLDKITDIVLRQTIADRWFGLWKVGVQTASSGGVAAEAVLYGVIDPKAFRRTILEARDHWLEHGMEASARAVSNRRSVEVESEARIVHLLEVIAANTRPGAAAAAQR